MRVGQYTIERSCGVVLSVLLCGRHSFTGKCLQDGDLKINLKAGLWQNVSYASKQMVLQLLVKDPDLRLSGAEILDDPWFRDDPATCEDARSTLYSDRSKDDSGRGISIRTISSHISCLSVGDESEVVVGGGETSGQSTSTGTVEENGESRKMGICENIKENVKRAYTHDESKGCKACTFLN